VLLAWTAGGLVLAAVDLRARRSQTVRRWSGVWLIAAAIIPAGILYAGAASPNLPNPSDDWLAYLPFVKMIQQTGTFLDPFNVRRMGALGGQSYLQSFVQLVASDDRLGLFDQGVCQLLVIGLIVGAVREAERVAAVVLLVMLAFLLTLPEIRINSASEMSGVVGFLALYRTLVFVGRRGLSGMRAAALVALPAAAACTLRQNYQLVVGCLLAGLAIERGASGRERLRTLARTGAVLLALLLPWSILAFRSNHTFLFPLMAGNYDPNYAAITGPTTADARLQSLWSAALHHEPIRTLPILLLAAPVLARGAHRAALSGFWLGTIAGFVMLALSLPDAGNFTIARYNFGFVVAFALAAGHAASEAVLSRRTMVPLLGVSVVVFALAAQVQRSGPVVTRNYAGAIGRLTAMPPTTSPLALRADEFRRMQAAVPPRERLFVMIERPYHLDYARNPVLHLDLPGAASPRPGLPLTAGGEAAAEYLLSQGLRYLAFTRPDSAETDIYRRAHWRKQLTGRWPIWRNTAPFFLHAFDIVDELAASRRKLHDDGKLVVVDLATRAR
jgi:hypothetical protein